ncbi:MAG TPA: AraC family transcriptional regulator [Rhizobacter sp.]|jgi:AraC-like DNA-binding protein|nr:AraC family transcriptional regulator [Rhizobacter sp.]
MNQDTLSDVLRNVRLRGALYFNVSGTRDWAAEAPPSREIAAAVMPGAEHVMEFHVVLAGACWAATVGGEPVHLAAGDIVIFAHGDPHVVSSAPGMRAPPDAQGYFERQQQHLPFTLHLDACQVHAGTPPTGAADTVLVCGFLGCDLRPFNPLIAALPRLLHLPSAGGQDWAVQCMRQAAAESANRRPGGGAMLERLSEMMFIDAMRRHLGALPEGSQGWLAGLHDRFVGPALTLLHAAPEEPWTVEELSHRVGLSRSALHERFAALIGQAPMQYLANWRMQVGATLLRETACSVAAVAQQVGYESEAAFARAFKRLVGLPPAVWRRKVKA